MYVAWKWFREKKSYDALLLAHTCLSIWTGGIYDNNCQYFNLHFCFGAEILSFYVSVIIAKAKKIANLRIINMSCTHSYRELKNRHT